MPENKKKNRKKVAIAALLSLALVGGGTAAFAYWTNSGSGSGTAATGSNSPITVNQTSTISNLRPGGAAQTLSGNFSNPAANGPVYVTSVTATVGTVTKATGAPAGTCTASDYVITDPTVSIGREIATGAASDSWSGPKIAFNNKADANQDACKNATVTINYTSN
jgi:hypothetical protein